MKNPLFGGKKASGQWNFARSSERAQILTKWGECEGCC